MQVVDRTRFGLMCWLNASAQRAIQPSRYCHAAGVPLAASSIEEVSNGVPVINRRDKTTDFDYSRRQQLAHNTAPR